MEKFQDNDRPVPMFREAKYNCKSYFVQPESFQLFLKSTISWQCTDSRLVGSRLADFLVKSTFGNLRSWGPASKM